MYIYIYWQSKQTNLNYLSQNTVRDDTHMTSTLSKN